MVDYWISAEANCSMVVAINSLVLKAVSKLQPPAAATAGAASTAAEDLLYEISWPAAQPAALSGSASAAVLSGALRMECRDELVAVAGAVAALQASGLESLGGVQLTGGSVSQVALPAAGGSGRVGSAASLPALLRTTALEYQAQQFGSVDVDRHAPAAAGSACAELALLASGAAPTAGVYGVALRGGTSQQATLLHATARSGIPAFHLMPRPRGAMSSLRPEPVPISNIAPGQVLVEVNAVGINFR